MDRRHLIVVLWSLGAAGCAAQQAPVEPPSVFDSSITPWEPSQPPNVPGAAKNGTAGETVSRYANPAASAPPKYGAAATGATSNASAADPAALQKVMAELQALGNVDAATQQQLLTDFQQTDPALWPMLMQTFRAGLVYRRQQTKGPDATTAARPQAGKGDAPQSATADRTEPAPPPDNSSVVTTAAESLIPSAEEVLGGAGVRTSSTPGLSFPSQTLLTAALTEARRSAEAANGRSSAPQVAEIETANSTKPSSAESQVERSERPASDNWQAAVASAIERLEPQTRESPRDATEVSRHVWLRMLYLAAGRRDDALKPISGIAAAEQDYWTEQIYALAAGLDAERTPDAARRSAEVRRHLARAEARLAETGTLTVRGLAFCNEVSSYGVYERFKSYDFKPSQPLILYAEIDNFKSEETTKGFHTALRSSYQILDAQGRRVAENDLALTEEYCQNRRRDYFIRYFLSVPERIYEGKYTLQLTIVDTLSQKIGQGSIEFNVVGEK